MATHIQRTEGLESRLAQNDSWIYPGNNFTELKSNQDSETTPENGTGAPDEQGTTEPETKKKSDKKKKKKSPENGTGASDEQGTTQPETKKKSDKKKKKKKSSSKLGGFMKKAKGIGKSLGKMAGSAAIG